jgi:excisionase family DNA binding protein
MPEAAEALGIARSMVYKLIRKRDLPSVHLGRRTGISNEAFREY